MNLKRQLKSIVFEILWSFLRHEKSQRDICLFASRRGGSTWLQEVICQNGRIRAIDQPFSFYSGPPFLHEHLPIMTNSLYLHLDQEDEARVKKYVDRIFAGHIVHGAQWRFWKKSFFLKSNRVLLKITKGKSLMEWFSDTYDDVDIVWLIRHPIAQSLSVIKAGWENDSKVYLQNHFFVGKYLTPNLQELGKTVLNKGDILEKYVLNWCLESLVPFRTLQRKSQIILISYEESVLKPESMANYLSERLELDNRDSMTKGMSTPSRTTKFTHTNVKSINWQNKLQNWEKNVPNHLRNRCFDIIEQFGINLYSRSSLMPLERYQLFHEGGN